MAEKLEVKRGTLALTILRTLDVLGPLGGYGVGRRIEETSQNRFTLDYGRVSRPHGPARPADANLGRTGGRRAVTGNLSDRRSFYIMPQVIPPAHDRGRVSAVLRDFPVVGLLGARQVGKSTLARQVVDGRRGPSTWFDLEHPADAARLAADPMLALRDSRGLLTIDEIHLAPNLFPVLRVLVDEAVPGRRVLVLGSASPDLLRQGSETLAGRIASHDLQGLRLSDVGSSTACAGGCGAASPAHSWRAVMRRVA